MTTLKELENVHWEFDHDWSQEKGDYTAVAVTGFWNGHEFGYEVYLQGHVEPHHPIFQKAVAEIKDQRVHWEVEGIEEIGN